MAIWLIALSSGAALPRRVVYVVDRRAVVDQASAEAAEIADAYRRNIGDEIAISTLRGQHVDSGAWREDPSRPAIIVGTVDMIGSRLMFEGYGVSRRMRPMHAGLLGTDALIVLDEAHLVPAFQALIAALVTDPALAGRGALPVPRLKLMSLSATQRNPPRVGDVFRLGPDDREHPEVARRLDATKRLAVRSVKDTEASTGAPEVDRPALAEALVYEAVDVAASASSPVRIVVYCDSRETAERVEQHLSEAGHKTILFTGARRVHERELAAAELRGAGFIAGAERAETTSFLVATSAGEVGVDLDADHAVMDLVPWERMVQRLGRVNRRGLGAASVRVVDPELSTSPSGVPLEAVRRLLERLPTVEGGALAGPAALEELAGREPYLVQQSMSPAPLRPALSLPLVEAWALTGLREHSGRPEVEPWLRGWVEDDPQTRIVWRAHLPRRAHNEVKVFEIETFFAHARPHLSEMLETETHRARDWLYARAKALHASDVADELEKLDVAFLLAPDGGLRARHTLGKLALWAGRKISKEAQRERDAFERALAGRTLVIDAALGGLTGSGLLDKNRNEGAVAADSAEGWEVGFTVRPGGPTTDAPAAAYRLVTRFSAEGEPEAWLDIVLADREDTNEDAPSRALRDVPLAEHERAVEAEVRRIAGRLGVEARWVELLATAAQLHDRGKAAQIWQNAMKAPSAGRPFAKTRRGDGRALMGYRHEFGSLLAAEREPAVQAMDTEDRDLVLHLIAAHHGNARPVIGVESCPEGPPTAMEAAGLEVALRYGRLQKRWGPWGVAWWESLLRAADQAASKEGC